MIKPEIWSNPNPYTEVYWRMKCYEHDLMYESFDSLDEIIYTINMIESELR